MAPRTALVEKIMGYVDERLKGFEYTWNVKSEELEVVYNGKKYNVCNFLVSCWGIGHMRNGGLAWKFKYSKKVVGDIENNEDFRAAIDTWLVGYFQKG